MIATEISKNVSLYSVIQERVVLAPDLYQLTFAGSLPTAQPGQYSMVGLPRFDEKPFMIAGNDPLQILVKRSGPFTQLLTDATVHAQKFTVRGPFGHGFSLPEILDADCSIVIDTVAGLAAGRFLLEVLQHTGYTQLHLFLGKQWLHAAVTFFNPDALQLLQTSASQHQQELTARMTQSEYLYFATAIPEVIHPILSLAVSRREQRKLISAQGIFTQGYIACAIGICGRCAQQGFLDGKLLCTEGPVFELLTH